MRRIGLSVLVATAFAAAAASPADAAIWGPGCTATLTPAAATSCGFDSPTDWAMIRVTPVGTVTATLRCSNFGVTTTRTRTVSANTTWSWSAGGVCNLSLTAVSAGAVANASATPGIPPIIDPPPPTS